MVETRTQSSDNLLPLKRDFAVAIQTLDTSALFKLPQQERQPAHFGLAADLAAPAAKP
ncbi:hypothetical protein [Mycobacterium avium]|uniref:hypothetical protein n=1 Tax=Mycobacterium avium TaxID=1764 RepID=UPI0012DADDD8|nr:hypothetical protein [Mycobacterium avium]